MIYFFRSSANLVYVIESNLKLEVDAGDKLSWLLNGKIIDNKEIKGWHIGPRKEMLTPWSTNAVEITQNMGMEGITRIERFFDS